MKPRLNMDKIAKGSAASEEDRPPRRVDTSVL